MSNKVGGCCGKKASNVVYNLSYWFILAILVFGYCQDFVVYFTFVHCSLCTKQKSHLTDECSIDFFFLL